jgi:hypothetical protein
VFRHLYHIKIRVSIRVRGLHLVSIRCWNKSCKLFAAHPVVPRFLTPRVGIGPLCSTSLRVARIEDWQLPTSELRSLVETYKDILEEKLLGPVLAASSLLQRILR